MTGNATPLPKAHKGKTMSDRPIAVHDSTPVHADVDAPIPLRVASDVRDQTPLVLIRR